MLLQALDEIQSDEMFVLLGDLNARVGSRDEEEDDIWGRYIGYMVLGNLMPLVRNSLLFWQGMNPSHHM